MFDALTDKFNGIFRSLSGRGKISEENIRESMREVRTALLEADVNFKVVNDFTDHVIQKAIGQEVIKSLQPGQLMVKIVYDELVNLMGPVDHSLHLQPGVTVLMLCGLQGSGKTTTCGKLGRLINERGRKPMLVAADLQRPAAIEQLHVLGRQLDVPVYSELGAQNPVKVCQDAVKKARELQVNVVILDTAGRLAIDRELMDQLTLIDKRVGPDQVFLVVDGMTGQDAVNSAQAFNEALELDGVIMTKLDGDARGGALLSVKQVTGVPIKFIGTGEQLDALEPFRPEGMVGRILGMGDMVGLVDVVRQAVDEKQQKELEEKLAAGEFTLDDFKTQLKQIMQPGLMQKLIGMMPGMGEMSKMMQNEDAAGGAKRLVGIIDGMTPQERRNPKVIDPSRRNRIAKGSGVPVQEVNALLKQYDTTAPIMKAMAGKGPGGRMQAIRELQQSGMMNPGANIGKPKGNTGKRLTSQERADLKRKREKELRKKKREGKK
jgi:signal recognition particle subunit SRP54